MSTAHTAKSPGGAGPYAANQNQPADCTSDASEKIAFTGRPVLTLDSARQQKELATLVAQFALAGHAVHKGQSDDFIVCKQGLSKYCQDASALLAFARLVGAAP